MDITVPQGLPVDIDDDDGIPTETVIETNLPETELDDWVTTPVSSCSDLNPGVRKITVSTSRLFLLQVEYSDPALDYARSALSSFEPGAEFSPQPSTSLLSDFEHRVSPLDPNLSSAARYSPVYGSLSTVTANGNEELQMPPVCDGYHGVVTTCTAEDGTLLHQFQSVEPGEALSVKEGGEVSHVLTNMTYTLEPSSMYQTTEELNIVPFDADLEATMKAANSSMDLLLVDPFPDTPDTTGSGFQSPGRLIKVEQHQNQGTDECVTYDSSCQSLGIQTIADKPVPLRSWATLPASYLAIMKINNGSTDSDCGVFARKTIPKRTQFGPVEGILCKPVVSSNAGDDPTAIKLLLEEESGEMFTLDTTDENCSNWMRYVRGAPSLKDQNLVLSQQGHALYFTTTKVIHPRHELMVWYSPPYAKKRGLPILLPNDTGDTVECDATWPCFECNQHFITSDDLQKHLNVHDTQREDADIMGKSLKTKKNVRSLKRKILSLYSSKKYGGGSDKQELQVSFQCMTCERTFPRMYSLKRHQLMHLGGGKYSCHFCNQNFSHIVNRDRHIRKYHSDLCKKNLPGEWQCKECWLIFASPSLLRLHSSAHPANETMTVAIMTADMDTACQLVEDYQPTVEYLVTTEEEVLCPQCGVEFGHRQELVHHVEIHAKVRASRLRVRGSVNPAKPCKCELCYKAFATEERLQRHMLVHGADESKPLECSVCNKRFLNNSALTCHVKIHTEKKMFECPICKVVYDQVLALKEHVHIHASDGIFTCPQCNKMFEEYSLIRKHIRAFHSDRKHDCSYCAKLFPTLDKLRMHMLRHSDHREFLCANCGKQFKRKDKLKEHMKRMHSAEREQRLATKPHRSQPTKKFIPKVQISPSDYHRFIYKCHSCLLGFKRRGMLVNHLAKRHPDISPESVPELNLPILKTTRDYYCQYCEKVYKSSSKRKAHILKNHPGAELPMSNRRKGGVPDIPGVPNPTFSQTVGSITTCPHGCPWCHKQYASKAKLLQHQRKKHVTMLPSSQQVARVLRAPTSPGDDGNKSHHITTLMSANDFHNMSVPDDLNDDESLIDASDMKRPLKLLGDSDLLSQAMSELSQSLGEFRVSADQYHQLLAAGDTYTPYTER